MTRSEGPATNPPAEAPAGNRKDAARAAGCFLVAFGLAWTAGVGMADWIAGRMFSDQWGTNWFVPMTGTVVSSEVEVASGDDSVSYHPKIAYEYEVNGRKHRSDKYRFGMMPSTSEQAEKAVAAHAPGSSTTVYYDPLDPSRSVLKPGLKPGDWFMLLFMVPFNVAMFGFWIAGWRRLHRRSTIAGGARIIESAEGVRARLNDVTPLMAAGLAIGAIAFAAVFVIMIASHWMKNSDRIMQGAWALTLIGGLWAYVASLASLRRGDHDIAISDLHGTILLPRTVGRDRPVKLETTKVCGVRTETEEKKDSDGDPTFKHFTVIELRGAGGAGEAVRAAEWTNEERAKSFAAWLRDRLNLPVRWARETETP